LRLNAGMGSTSSDEQVRGGAHHGFSLVELTAVLAVVATVAVVATPTLLGYWDSWSLQAGARELASVINLGRQLAISARTPVCLDVIGGAVRFRIGGCTGDVWTGAVTDASGAIRVSDPATLAVSSNARLVFTTLGAASPAATFTIRHARTHASRSVVVAASGRISIE
jgi:prepilin-type N-terminal cleavage/methylation domain-containing protein